MKQAVVLLMLALSTGFIRQFAPHGIAWNGRWPTSATSAEDAYKMMAKENDPPFVDLAQALEWHEKKSAIFLDARASQEYIEGHIPGARTIPYYELDQYQDAALKGIAVDTLVVIYCEGVGCELSFFLGRDLTQAGYKNLHIFYGGYPEWKTAGFPIEK